MTRNWCSGLISRLAGGRRLERAPFIDLTPQEVMALIRISNSGGGRAGVASEDNLTRLTQLVRRCLSYQTVR
jgi:hypothetical protein